MTFRPASSEYNRYYRRYTDKVADGDIRETLTRQMRETQALLAAVPSTLEEHRYAPGKWSVREVVGHCIDTERVFAFRTLWIARGADGGQPGMDENLWAAASNAGARSLASLAAEWAGLRQDYVTMLGSFTAEALARVGRASRKRISARALPWIIAGHELHHRGMLEREYGLRR